MSSREDKVFEKRYPQSRCAFCNKLMPAHPRRKYCNTIQCQKKRRCENMKRYFRAHPEKRQH
jgi:hypothetical protein